MHPTLSQLARELREAVHPLSGAEQDYDLLMKQIGDARFVLIGEASHGTHEFYHWRAEITKRLIRDQGFRAVAVEADWPDAYNVNCYVRGAGAATTSNEALGGFQRFPTWMWRNTVVRDFIDWLRDYNSTQSHATVAGFYGLDLYSLYTSIDAVLNYLDTTDPEAAHRARERYSCFTHFNQDSQMYGYAANIGIIESCEDAVLEQLVELQRGTGQYTAPEKPMNADQHFYALQNARLIKNAEEYYRAMFRGHVESWNLRDQHMAETLDALVNHLDQQQAGSKVVVWAHNSHLGDARATEMGRRGELNLGQLVRERYGDAALLLGFSTYTGTVTAASDWGAPPEYKQVRPGLPDSYEALFHEVGLPGFLLSLQQNAVVEQLRKARLERAIGVIYRPQTERLSHYFSTCLPEQFDLIIHVDTTRAIEPLDQSAMWQPDEVPETFPSAL